MKIKDIIDNFSKYRIEICTRNSITGDFGWFEQRGNVYSDSDTHSNYTKYINLHLGAAYDSMTSMEYYEFMGKKPEKDHDGNDIYFKPGCFP